MGVSTNIKTAETVLELFYLEQQSPSGSGPPHSKDF